MNVGEWISVVGIAAALTTFSLAHLQRQRLARAQLVKGYVDSFHTTAGVTKIFQKIDYGEFRFTEDFLSSAEELGLIALLDLLGSVGHAVKRGILTIEDVRGSTLGYAAMIMQRDRAVQRYLSHVMSEDRELGFDAGGSWVHYRWLAGQL